MASVRRSRRATHRLREEITLYNAVMFNRADDGSSVYIVPEFVVKVEPLQRQFVTRITPITGEPEVVEGAPSEVNKRLRSGQ